MAKNQIKDNLERIIELEASGGGAENFEDLKNDTSVFGINGKEVIENLDTRLTTNTNNINNNTQSIVSVNDRLSAVENAIGVQLLFQQKTTSVAPVSIISGNYGFNLSNNWTAPETDDKFEIVNSTRQDVSSKDIYGWQLKTGQTLTGKFELQGKLTYSFGTVASNDKAVLNIIQYKTLSDFQNGTNGFKILVGNVSISNNDDNRTIPYDLGATILNSVDGLWLEPQFEVQNGGFEVGLAGSDNGYQSFFRLITQKASAVIGSDDVNVNSTSTRPNLLAKNQLQINEQVDLKNEEQDIAIDEKADNDVFSKTLSEEFSIKSSLGDELFYYNGISIFHNASLIFKADGPTLNMGGNPIVNVGTPVSENDATPKIYVDEALAKLEEIYNQLEFD